MSVGGIVLAALAALALGSLLWLGCRWLASAWEVLDDDQLTDKLSGAGRASHSPADWLRLHGWFRRRPRRLFYRRDRRGRFRKIWRG